MQPGQNPPPGWYPGEGDPIGTERYWNGAAWSGEPRPIGGGHPPPPASYAPGPPAFGTRTDRPQVDFLRRVYAFMIDYSFVLVPWLISQQLTWQDPFRAAGDMDVFLSDTEGIVLLVLWTVGLIGYLVNRVVIQGITGQSIGKRVIGLKLVRVDDPARTPAGLSRTSGRFLSGFALSLVTCGIFTAYDHLALLWNDDGRRVVDRWTGLDVVDLKQQ